MARHNELGKLGEQLATELLIKKGYIIRECNWKCNHVEIDIVAEYKSRIVIVEVKSRTSDYVSPLDSINKKKIRNLINAANAYITFYDIKKEVQFDIITLIGNESDIKIEHIADAFLPPLKSY